MGKTRKIPTNYSFEEWKYYGFFFLIFIFSRSVNTCLPHSVDVCGFIFREREKNRGRQTQRPSDIQLLVYIREFIEIQNKNQQEANIIHKMPKLNPWPKDLAWLLEVKFSPFLRMKKTHLFPILLAPFSQSTHTRSLMVVVEFCLSLQLQQRDS